MVQHNSTDRLSAPEQEETRALCQRLGKLVTALANELHELTQDETRLNNLSRESFESTYGDKISQIKHLCVEELGIYPVIHLGWLAGSAFVHLPYDPANRQEDSNKVDTESFRLASPAEIYRLVSALRARAERITNYPPTIVLRDSLGERTFEIPLKDVNRIQEVRERLLDIEALEELRLEPDTNAIGFLDLFDDFQARRKECPSGCSFQDFCLRRYPDSFGSPEEQISQDPYEDICYQLGKKLPERQEQLVKILASPPLTWGCLAKRSFRNTKEFLGLLFRKAN